MNINDLTIGQAKELVRLISSKTEDATFTPHIGKMCIVRTYASGVFYGRLVAQNGRMVEIEKCRRLWRWQAATGISLSAVAVNGIDHSGCKITEPVSSMTLLDALEILPASEKAQALIDACPVAGQS